MQKPFWQTKTLFEMTHDEWESLCDGCGKCCLIQLQDEDSETICFTDIACELFDAKTCRCSDYSNRTQRVPSCMAMTVDNVNECAEFAPTTCAYRLILEEKPLPEWHHLLSGDTGLVHTEGHSVMAKVRHKDTVKEKDYENYIIDWC